jgi:hypothetical protein
MREVMLLGGQMSFVVVKWTQSSPAVLCCFPISLIQVVDQDQSATLSDF